MVSIIVTHKKDTLYLKDCLESIAEQQFKDYETILVVDHTEDNIEPLIEEFKDKINLKVFYLEDKHGVSSACSRRPQTRAPPSRRCPDSMR